MHEMNQPHDSVYAFAMAQEICFAAHSDGLDRSVDGGLTWKPAYDTFRSTAPLATISVALSPSFHLDRTVFAGLSGGVLHSMDQGESWYGALFPPPAPLPVALVVSPNFEQDGLVIAATMQDGIFRSTDRGMSWVSANFGLVDLNTLCLVASPAFGYNQSLYVGTETGIFHSTNGGLAWRETGFPNELGAVLSLAIAPTPDVNPTLFAGTEAHGLFRSADGGATWARVSEMLNGCAVEAIRLAENFPVVPTLFIVASGSLLTSYDEGISWQPLLENQIVTAIEAWSVYEKEMRMLVGLDKGGIVRLVSDPGIVNVRDEVVTSLKTI